MAGPLSLRRIVDDCCLIPLGDGLIEWTYELPDVVARRLMSRCVPVLAGAHFDGEGSRDCILTERPFEGEPRGVNGGREARLTGNRLHISVWWL